MDGRLRARGVAARGELAQRQLRMAETQPGDLVEAIGEVLEGAVSLQRALRPQRRVQQSMWPEVRKA